MNMRIRSILVNLALIGLVVSGRLAGAQEDPAGAGLPPAAEIHVGPASPGNVTGLDGHPAEMPTAAGDTAAGEYADVFPDSTVDATESVLPEQSVSLDGGTLGECPLGPCCEICGNGDCCPPNWYTTQEARLLTRSRPGFISLATADEFIGFDSGGLPVFSPVTVLSNRSAAFDYTGGYAVTLGRYLGRDTENRDRFFEFCFWGLNDWQETRAISGERLTDSTTFAPNVVTFGSLNAGQGARTLSGIEQVTGAPTTTFHSPVEHSIRLKVGGFNRIDRQQVSYESNINNFELNLRFNPRSRPGRLVLYPEGRWRRECQRGMVGSYLVGVRVMSIDEGFDWRTQGRFEVDGTPFSEVSAAYLVTTHNDLVGLQFGGELMYRNCKYSWGARAKAGPYINFASHVSRVTTDAAGDPYAQIFPDYRISASKDDMAFIGEAGLVGTYKWRPNLILRASYDFMWVAGLAIAPEQITYATDPPDSIKVKGLGAYQGLSLGFEWLW